MRHFFGRCLRPGLSAAIFCSPEVSGFTKGYPLQSLTRFPFRRQPSCPHKHLAFRASVLKPCRFVSVPFSRFLFPTVPAVQVFRTSDLPNFRSPELHQKTSAYRFVMLYPLHGFGKKSGTTHDPYFLRFLFEGNRVGNDQFTQL